VETCQQTAKGLTQTLDGLVPGESFQGLTAPSVGCLRLQYTWASSKARQLAAVLLRSPSANHTHVRHALQWMEKMGSLKALEYTHHM
jgi:hypothetical protein